MAVKTGPAGAGVHALYVLGAALVSCGAAYAQDAPCAECMRGPVTGIIDGDTLDIGPDRIRLALVDAPEMGDPGYEEAAAFAASLCREGDEAFYDPDDGQPGGSHGRTVAEVFCGGKSLNEELVLKGHARILYGLCGTSEFAARPWAGCGDPDSPAYGAQYVIPAVLAAACLAALVAWRSRRPDVGAQPDHL